MAYQQASRARMAWGNYRYFMRGPLMALTFDHLDVNERGAWEHAYPGALLAGEDLSNVINPPPHSSFTILDDALLEEIDQSSGGEGEDESLDRLQAPSYTQSLTQEDDERHEDSEDDDEDDTHDASYSPRPSRSPGVRTHHPSRVRSSASTPLYSRPGSAITIANSKERWSPTATDYSTLNTPMCPACAGLKKGKGICKRPAPCLQCQIRGFPASVCRNVPEGAYKTYKYQPKSKRPGPKPFSKDEFGDGGGNGGSGRGAIAA